MQPITTFKHPVHLLHYARKMMREYMASCTPNIHKVLNIPELCKDFTYYFMFETHPRFDLNMMLYSLLCFSHDGEIIFSRSSQFPVSLWRYNRQGFTRTATMINGIITNVFRSENIPLNLENPFMKAENNLYICNIEWTIYEKSLTQY